MLTLLKGYCYLFVKLYISKGTQNMLGHNNSMGHADNIIKSKELFEFAVSYLTNKGYYHWDFSNYAPVK